MIRRILRLVGMCWRRADIPKLSSMIIGSCDGAFQDTLSQAQITSRFICRKRRDCKWLEHPESSIVVEPSIFVNMKS
jgi:hypothetical protein